MNNKIAIKDITNPYSLPPGVVEKLVDIMNDYVSKLENTKIDALTLREKLGYLGVISELYPILNDKESYLYTCQSLLVQLRDSIYGSEFFGISLYDGLSNLALFVKPLTIYTGCYKKFTASLEALILKNVNAMVQKLSQDKDSVSFSHYDTICGLAGIGNYLLEDSEDEAVRKTLEDIANYFVYISNKVEIDGSFYPGWIELNNKNSELEEGYIDFSIAHGIAGPLYLLVKLAQRNIIVPGHLDAISRVIKEYEYISNRTSHNIWSGKIPKQHYFDDRINVIYRRESWCYGNASVAMIFLETAELTGDKLLHKIAKEKLLEISQKDINALGLDTPILCHGYAGMTTLFRRLYDKYGGEEYLLQAAGLAVNIIDSYSMDSKYGFPYYELGVFNGNKEKRSIDKIDFLEGSAGIIMEMASWLKETSYFEKMLLFR